MYLSHSIDRTMAYSMIALNMLKIQVMINLSIALSLLLADDGAFDLNRTQVEAYSLIKFYVSLNKVGSFFRVKILAKCKTSNFFFKIAFFYTIPNFGPNRKKLHKKPKMI